MGPVIDQFKTLTDEFKSVAMVSKDTTKIVMVALVVKRPASTTNNVAHFFVRPTFRAILRGIINVHGTTDTSSTPPCSKVIVAFPCGASSSFLSLREFMGELQFSSLLLHLSGHCLKRFCEFGHFPTIILIDGLCSFPRFDTSDLASSNIKRFACEFTCFR